jgi:hypothetical protein
MSTLPDLIREPAEPLSGSPRDYDSLPDLVGDARFVLHFDHTRAVEPLERAVEWQSGEVEETFPSGL